MRSSLVQIKARNVRIVDLKGPRSPGKNILLYTGTIFSIYTPGCFIMFGRQLGPVGGFFSGIYVFHSL